ncbi:MAG TPA: hypothetical protein VIU15_37270 [Streptomyces sp.]
MTSEKTFKGDETVLASARVGAGVGAFAALLIAGTAGLGPLFPALGVLVAPNLTALAVGAVTGAGVGGGSGAALKRVAQRAERTKNRRNLPASDTTDRR